MSRPPRTPGATHALGRASIQVVADALRLAQEGADLAAVESSEPEATAHFQQLAARYGQVRAFFEKAEAVVILPRVGLPRSASPRRGLPS